MLTGIGSGTGTSMFPPLASQGLVILPFGGPPLPATISTMGAPVTITGTTGSVTPAMGLFDAGIDFVSPVTITANGTDAPITMTGILGNASTTTLGIQVASPSFLAGTGPLTFNADRISLVTPVAISGTGSCSFDVVTLTQPMHIGDNSPPATDFVLSNAEIGFLSDGFSEIVMGNAAGLNTMNIDGMDMLTFTDPVRFRAQNINLNDELMAGANPVTFQIGRGAGGIFNLNNLVTTTGAILAEGGVFDDIFNININCAPMTVNGGGGTCDLLVGPPGNNTWNITGANSGNFVTSLADTITFSDIESVQGGTANDLFKFCNTASLSCTVDDGSAVPVAINLLDYTNFSPNPAFVIFQTATSGIASNMRIGFIRILGFFGNIVTTVTSAQSFLVQLNLAQRFLTDMFSIYEYESVSLSVIGKFLLYGVYWGNINDTNIDYKEGMIFDFERDPHPQTRSVLDFGEGKSPWYR